MTVAGGQQLAVVQSVLAVLAGIGAWAFAPELDSAAQHDGFKEFFATSAQVIAALLVALAIESRLAVRHKLLAVTTAICLALGAVSAVTALSPALSDAAYRWLFVCTVGGGVGALVAAIVVGAQTLIAEAEAAALDELRAVAQRAERDKATG